MMADLGITGKMADLEGMLPKNTGAFAEVMNSEVVAVVCRRCGSETIMNKKYAEYVPGGSIADCGKCRNSLRP